MSGNLSFDCISCCTGFIPAPDVKEVEFLLAEINFKVKIRVTDLVVGPVESERYGFFFTIEEAYGPLFVLQRFNPYFSTVYIFIFKCLYPERILVNCNHLFICEDPYR